jgi:hypothetical protein
VQCRTCIGNSFAALAFSPFVRRNLWLHVAAFLKVATALRALRGSIARTTDRDASPADNG